MRNLGETRRLSKCRTCDAWIVWARTEGNKRIPLDPEPVLNGNIVLEAEGSIARVVPPRPDVKRYNSHFVTCPNAAQHRRR